ncbi:hypothetical protein HKX48_006217 [Thoreauomyces humboldtii]|nr:hypothetical protein HKX48_006217 [Thoreauomyces humboldtii]
MPPRAKKPKEKKNKPKPLYDDPKVGPLLKALFPEDGHVPSLRSETDPTLPPPPDDDSELHAATAYDMLFERNRAREEHVFNLRQRDIIANNTPHELRSILDRSLPQPFLHQWQATAAKSIVLYQAERANANGSQIVTDGDSDLPRIYNSNDRTFSELPDDPREILPRGVMPGYIGAPVGAGKSRVLVTAAGLHEGTIVAVPLSRIKDDMPKTFIQFRDAAGLAYSDIVFHFSDATEEEVRDGRIVQMSANTEDTQRIAVVSRLIDSSRLASARIVVVTTPTLHAGGNNLGTIMSAWKERGGVRQIIFDEGHHAAAETYIACMKTLYRAAAERASVELPESAPVVNPFHVLIFSAFLDRLDRQIIRAFPVYTMPLYWARITGLTANYLLTLYPCNVAGVMRISKEKKAFLSTPSGEDALDEPGLDPMEDNEPDNGEADSGEDEFEPDAGDQELEATGQLTKAAKTFIAKFLRDDEPVQRFLVDETCDRLLQRTRAGACTQALFCCVNYGHASAALGLVNDWIARQPVAFRALLEAGMLHSRDTLQETAQKNKMVNDGSIQLIVQCGMYGEGVDVPSIKIVTFLTRRSLSVAYQLFGRAARMLWYNSSTHNGRYFNIPAASEGNPRDLSLALNVTTQFNDQYSLRDVNTAEIIMPLEFYMAHDIRILDKSLVDVTKIQPVRVSADASKTKKKGNSSDTTSKFSIVMNDGEPSQPHFRRVDGSAVPANQTGASREAVTAEEGSVVAAPGPTLAAHRARLEDLVNRAAAARAPSMTEIDHRKRQDALAASLGAQLNERAAATAIEHQARQEALVALLGAQLDDKLARFTPHNRGRNKRGREEEEEEESSDAGGPSA